MVKCNTRSPESFSLDATIVNNDFIVKAYFKDGNGTPIILLTTMSTFGTLVQE